MCAPPGIPTYLWSTGSTSQCISTGTAGTYTVTVTDANGCATSCNQSIAVNPLPVPSFSGLAATYALSDPPAALTGSPPGGIFSGPGINGNTFSPASAGAGGPYTIVYAYTDSNGCSNSSSQQTTVTNCTPPAKPGIITTTGGSTKICPGDVKSYSVLSVPGATSYTWIAPPGGTITNGQGTVQVTVSYDPGFTVSDTLRVIANNSCGSSQQRTLKITRGSVPAAPSLIAGPAFGVCNGSGVPYSVVNIAGLVYSWSYNVPFATILSGQGTNAITADYNSSFLSGTLTVTASNGCGTGNPRKLTVKAVPAMPASLSGTAAVCANQSGVAYSISPLAGAVNYKWSAPAGSHITDGVITSTGASLTTDSVSVTVNYGNTAGDLKVRANNSCGSGAYLIQSITFNCREQYAITYRDESFSIAPNPTDGNLSIIFNSSINQPAGLTLLNAMGQKLYAEKWNLESGENKKELKIPNEMAPGIYHIVIQTENSILRQIVLKN